MNITLYTTSPKRLGRFFYLLSNQTITLDFKSNDEVPIFDGMDEFTFQGGFIKGARGVTNFLRIKTDYELNKVVLDYKTLLGLIHINDGTETIVGNNGIATIRGADLITQALKYAYLLGEISKLLKLKTFELINYQPNFHAGKVFDIPENLAAAAARDEKIKRATALINPKNEGQVIGYLNTVEFFNRVVLTKATKTQLVFYISGTGGNYHWYPINTDELESVMIDIEPLFEYVESK